jgi:hypothetical protein
MLKKQSCYLVVLPTIPELFSRSKDRPTEDSDLNKKLATVLTAQLQDSVNEE